MRISDWSSDVCSSDLFFARLGIMFALLVERLQLRPVEDLVANRVGQVLEPAIEIADLEALRSAAAACVTDQPEHDDRDRSEERRVGKECVSTCRSRWSQYH